MASLTGTGRNDDAERAGGRLQTETSQHFDVAIVGAGISGIGSAYHLKTQCPGTSFVILDAQDSFGGTWITHRYPGIRSDSDLYTFGYRFKPWTGKPIATADEILAYLGEVIDENGLDAHIRYRRADLGGALVERRQSLDAGGEPRATARAVRFTANFLWMCQGYYRHEKGYTPEWDGMETFAGTDRPPAVLAGRSGLRRQECRRHRLRRDCGDAHSGDRRALQPRHDAAALADLLHHRPQRQCARRHAARARGQRGRGSTKSPAGRSSSIRRRSPAVASANRRPSRRSCFRRSAPISARTTTSRPISRRSTGPGGSASPSFRTAISSAQSARERASVVTDEIEKFTPAGILTKSGKLVEADIVVTATGFNLNVLGDIDFALDGQPLNFSETVTYRGIDVRRRAQHGVGVRLFPLELDAAGRPGRRFRLPASQPHEGQRAKQGGPEPPPRRQGHASWLHGSIPRTSIPAMSCAACHLLPKRGNKPEWRHSHDYEADRSALAQADLDDAALVYG